ncbi:MAG: GTP 3',8-cyclase MoaA [Bacteroidia bacterium]
MLKDTFHRVHDYLRISLTDNCDLRCFYCMPDEDISSTLRQNLMQPQEIAAIAQIFVDLGVRKIRLTGGEPLVRKEAAEIIELLHDTGVQLTMTTNGIRIHEFIPQLKTRGIQSVNISLDTLQADKFMLITRRDKFDAVRRNIDTLLEHDFHVKVNMVAMKGVNHLEIPDFVNWTLQAPVHVRFIEFMPFAGNHWHADKVYPLDQILEDIGKEHNYISLGKEPQATAHKYFVPGGKGTFAVISTMSHPFCGDCNRLRLTADGKLRNCLFAAKETDLLTPFRAGEDIVPLIQQTLAAKAAQLGGQFEGDFHSVQAEAIQNRSMIQIGG